MNETIYDKMRMWLFELKNTWCSLHYNYVWMKQYISIMCMVTYTQFGLWYLHQTHINLFLFLSHYGFCQPPSSQCITNIQTSFHMICQNKNPSNFEYSWHYLINMKIFWAIFKELLFFFAQPIYLFQRWIWFIHSC